MIELNQQLCDELDLTYWQLNNTNPQEHNHIFTISREEKELLRKILLVKGITLSEEKPEIHDDGIVIVSIKGHQLMFDDVTLQDKPKLSHLSKLSDMLNSVEQKKHTWYKLKNLEI